MTVVLKKLPSYVSLNLPGFSFLVGVEPLQCQYARRGDWRLGNALRHSQNIQCLVLQSMTWQRLAIFLESISDNPRINHLDLFFDMWMGETYQNTTIPCSNACASWPPTRLFKLCPSQRKLCTSQSHNLSWNSMHSVQTNSIHVLHMEDAINQDGINALSEALEVNTTTVESLAFSSVQRTPLLIIPIWCCHHASVLDS